MEDLLLKTRLKETFVYSRFVFKDEQKEATEKTKGGGEKPEEDKEAEESKEKEEKEKDVKKESKKKRIGLDRQLRTEMVAKESVDAVADATGMDEKMQGFMAGGIEWLKEKFKGSRNNFTSMILVVLDHVMEYKRPSENGGIQTRDDLLELADKMVKGQSDKESKLWEVQKEYMMLHKNNTVDAFKSAVEYRKQVDGVEQAVYGQNLEFDLRWNGEEVVVRHNSVPSEPEITLDQFIAIMKDNPGWRGKISMDVKDRQTIPQLEQYLERMPDNFREGVMIGTFDPEVVIQVHNTLNEGVDEDKRIPIILHVMPLYRYSDPEDAKKAIKFFNRKKSWIQDVVKGTVSDAANDPQASVGNAAVYSSYEEFQNAENPEADHILALVNPIKEIKEKDRKVFDAIIYSGGEFSFPYDPKYLEWIKNNSEELGLDFSNIGVGFLKTDHDAVYDALMWQDNNGNHISRISVDEENI